MRSSNPVLGRAFGNKRGYAAFEPRSTDALEEMYSSPSASPLQTGRMTMDDVVARTGILFGTALVVGAAAWYFNLQDLLIFGLIGGLVTGLIGAFSKKVRPALYLTYAVCQGLVLGIISKVYELFYDGIRSEEPHV